MGFLQFNGELLGVEAGGDVLGDEMLLKPPQLLVKNPVVVILKANELGKAWDEEAMHTVLGTRHQLAQRPKCIFF